MTWLARLIAARRMRRTASTWQRGYDYGAGQLLAHGGTVDPRRDDPFDRDDFDRGIARAVQDYEQQTGYVVGFGETA